MSTFQDELRRLEQESDRKAARDAAAQAAEQRKKDRAVAAARMRERVIEQCVDEAQAASSIAVERSNAGDGNAIWVLWWKDRSRGVEITLSTRNGQLCWSWQAERKSPVTSRAATDIDEAFIQQLVITLADQTAWRVGGFPTL
jgi:hypothetical protein